MELWRTMRPVNFTSQSSRSVSRKDHYVVGVNHGYGPIFVFFNHLKNFWSSFEF